MRETILLALDASAGGATRKADAAVNMIKELIRDRSDHVVVLYVREFSILRLPQTMTDAGGATGRTVVEQVVARLRANRIHAVGLIREADIGHVARAILAAADEFGARLIVLGSSGRTVIARVPFTGVASQLLHAASVPVLIVPEAPATIRQPAPALTESLA
jgi:nucleotide-binding universal stress UspA family protein